MDLLVKPRVIQIDALNVLVVPDHMPYRLVDDLGHVTGPDLLEGFELKEGVSRVADILRLSIIDRF